MFEDALLSLPCPKCGHTTKQKLVLLERNPQIPCPGCGSIIAVQADELKKSRQAINKSVEEFKKNIQKSFGRR